MNPKTYSAYESRILAAVQKLEDDGYFKGTQDKTFLVVNAFVMSPVQTNVNFHVEGSSLVSIAVVSAETGRIYYFALKELAPDVYEEIYGNGNYIS